MRTYLKAFLSLFWLIGLFLQAGQRPGSTDEIRAHLARAQRALSAGNLATAANEFAAILKINPDNVEARANLGVVRFLAGEYQDAAAEFKEVLRRQPGLAKAQALLGLCEMRLGHRDESEKLLAGAVPRLEGNLARQAGLELVEIFYQRGELDKAAAEIRSLERTDPGNPDILYTSWRIYSDLADRAREALASAAPESARMHQLMAQHLVRQADARGAIAQYRKALALDSKLPGARYELGEALLQDSTSDESLMEAEKQFRAALEQDPAEAGAEYRLGRIAALRQDWAQAERRYTRALELDPNHAYAHLGLGEVWMRTDRAQKALDQFQAAVKLDPGNSSAHYRLAGAYRELNRSEDAAREIAEFRRIEEAKKKIRSVYQEMHQIVPEKDTLPADIPAR